MRNPFVWILAIAAVAGALGLLANLPAWESDLSATRIHEIQGSGSRSPLTGDAVTVSGVVIGDFRDQNALGGFFVQEEDKDIDQDPATSEGIFIEYADLSIDLPIGHIVRVTGTVAERNGSTRLYRVTDVVVRKKTASAASSGLVLPFATTDAMEAFEGMRVHVAEELTVTGTYGLGRYGELTLSPERLAIPTFVAEPGPDACAIAEANDLSRIRLDDGLSLENPDPLRFPAEGLSTDHRIRAGDGVQDLTGIAHEDRRGYSILPTSEPVFEFSPRPVAPPIVGGRLQVVGFNVENYFNGNGDGTGFPTTRGAATPEEFARQRAKTIATLSALKPDIAGLCEIENDGYGPQSAIADLVRGLNEATGPQVTYDVIAPAIEQLGSDDIAVALIYRTESVRPIGDPVWPDVFSPLTRVPLAQAFEEVSSRERLTVVVNHFKSRSTSRASGANRDQGDEQGCWNLRRTEAAEALLAWLEQSIPGDGDPDILLIGDYNAYPNEDPIRILGSAGFVELLSRTDPLSSYTYVYDGEAGAIDLALASTTLESQVTGSAVWHINADESGLFDYRTRYKSPGQIEALYSEDPYRSSDHDPVVVGIDLGAVGP